MQQIKAVADWPRYMVARKTRTGATAFYWIPRKADVAAGFNLGPERLGHNYTAAIERAKMLNAHLDEWRDNKDIPPQIRRQMLVGTVDWWFDLYTRHEAFTCLTSRTQADYRKAIKSITDLTTNARDAAGKALCVGTLHVSSLSEAAVDKLYQRLRQGGTVNRRANYAIDIARRAWKVVRRQHPGIFMVPVTGVDGKVSRVAINPFESVVRAKYKKDTAKPATREQMQILARSAIDAGHPGLAAAAMICFEWLQRPEDVRSGRLRWEDYRPKERPTEVRIFHNKTGEEVWQPLEYMEDGGVERRLLYPEIEELLATMPRLGPSIVMFDATRAARGAPGTRAPRLYSDSYAQHIIQTIRKEAKLPKHITLEACRHGGMTELGDSGLTEQEIMSLSGHVTPAAARLYVKKTERQRRQAAVKRRDNIERNSK